MKPLAFVEPLQLDIAENATSPAAATPGVEIWSTTANKKLQWSGTAWVSSTGQAVTGIQTMATPEDTSQAGKYVQIAGGTIDPSLVTINHLKLKKTTINTATTNTSGTLWNGNLAGKLFTASYQNESLYGSSQSLYYYQPAVFTKRIRYFAAQAGSATPSLWCFVPTVQGTAIARPYVYDSVTAASATMMSRIGYLTAAGSTNAGAGIRDATAQYVRVAEQPGPGGVFMYTRLSIPIGLPTGSRFFCGFAGLALGTSEPSSNANFFGIGCDSTDSNISMMMRGSGTAAKTTLMPRNTFANPNTPVYDFAFWLPRSNNNNWAFSAKSIGAGLNVYDQSGAASMPSIGAPGLYPEIVINTGTTTTQLELCIHFIYIETDY